MDRAGDKVTGRAGASNKQKRRVVITTLGCKSNQYDSSALEDMMTEHGHSVVPLPGPADACVINTCTVTGRTDSESRQLIRKVRRLNPGAIVIVTGCYAQVSPGEVGSIDGVDYVVGNPEKARILEFIERDRPESTVTAAGRPEDPAPFTLRARTAGGRTRANFKVQEGCNRACSYCIIPMARGASKSLPAENIITELDSLVERGYKEVILTGIHLGAWGTDLPAPSDLTGLLRRIEERDYPCRFRISSLDPDEVDDELIGLLKGSKSICNHLHIALQSGDDSIIKMMKRPYGARLFTERVCSALENIPELSVGADVIAGFPGEGAVEFENTFEVLKNLPLSYLHIFPYSRRRGTAAESYAGQLDPKTIKERCARLKELDTEKRLAFYDGFIGRSAQVLIEAARDRTTGLLKGRARNYIPVLLDGPDSLMNTIARVRLESRTAEGMRGALEEEERETTDIA